MLEHKPAHPCFHGSPTKETTAIIQAISDQTQDRVKLVILYETSSKDLVSRQANTAIQSFSLSEIHNKKAKPKLSDVV